MKRSLLIGFAIIASLVIFAYGFAVTQVNLTELGQPKRQESLARILRALARPDLIEFEQQEFQVEAPIFVPCPASGAPTPAQPKAGVPTIVITPVCADPGAQVTVEGFDFAPNTTGPLNFIPPSGVSLQMGRIETDASGHFLLTVKLRDRTSPDAQKVVAVTRKNVGWPTMSRNGIDTYNKIIETVFMALLATVFGTLLSIPISFFAAQNLMRTVTSPLPSVALSLIAVPVGAILGSTVARWLAAVSDVAASNVLVNLLAVAIAPVVVLGVVRWLMPDSDEEAGTSAVTRWLRMAALLLLLLIVVLTLYFLSQLLVLLGRSVTPHLGAFAFLGSFVAHLGGILRLILGPICALVGIGITVNAAGRVGQALVEHLNPATGKIVNLALGAVAGAVLGAMLGSAAIWLYELANQSAVMLWPALIFAVLGLFLALRVPYNASLPIGYSVYMVTRTVLNALRSIEALIMVIVFAVWVGIGPFAGVLALGLHTVAALAKLYSEQVESIMEGPLEAVLATGANRLQMIIYAVIPQIVPPYISFTMYRWDINVRMSTIIGFAGGGGIGFLLQQNINLLNYRAASAQIVAIAIVVSLMDYLSSMLRQRAI